MSTESGIFLAATDSNYFAKGNKFNCKKLKFPLKAVKCLLGMILGVH